MPRNGSGVYSLPAGLPTNGETSNATDDILTPFGDLETDMNTVRPVVAGGTGAASTSAARTSLGLEIGSDVQAHSSVLDATTASYTTAEETKLSGIEAAANVTDATSVNAAGATMNTDTDVSGNDWVLDEDDMSSDSATKVPTQQSVKAYVDGTTASGWALLETPYDNDGTVTTVETSDFVDGYEYQIRILGLEMDTDTDGTDLELYGVTAGAYTSAVQFMGGASGNPYRYAKITLTTPRTSMDVHLINVTSSRASSGSGDAFFLGSNNDQSMVLRYGTAQKLLKARISGGDMASGRVEVWRRPV